MSEWKFISHFREEEWGKSILVMEKHGKAFAKIYYYYGDNDTYYFEGFSVVPEERKKGLGLTLFEFLEQIVINLNGETIFFWCKENSWMHDWYLHRGYKDDIKHESEENCIWMKKVLH